MLYDQSRFEGEMKTIFMRSKNVIFQTIWIKGGMVQRGEQKIANIFFNIYVKIQDLIFLLIMQNFNVNYQVTN